LVPQINGTKFWFDSKSNFYLVLVLIPNIILNFNLILLIEIRIDNSNFPNWIHAQHLYIFEFSFETSLEINKWPILLEVSIEEHFKWGSKGEGATQWMNPIGQKP
jgi:hypothetical protein